MNAEVEVVFSCDAGLARVKAVTSPLRALPEGQWSVKSPCGIASPLHLPPLLIAWIMLDYQGCVNQY